MVKYGLAFHDEWKESEIDKVPPRDRDPFYKLLERLQTLNPDLLNSILAEALNDRQRRVVEMILGGGDQSYLVVRQALRDELGVTLPVLRGIEHRALSNLKDSHKKYFGMLARAASPEQVAFASSLLEVTVEGSEELHIPIVLRVVYKKGGFVIVLQENGSLEIEAPSGVTLFSTSVTNWPFKSVTAY